MKYIIQDISNEPVKKLRGGRKLKFPFNELQSGKQMEIETKDKANISSCAYNYAKRKGIKFEVVRTAKGIIIKRTK